MHPAKFGVCRVRGLTVDDGRHTLGRNEVGRGIAEDIACVGHALRSNNRVRLRIAVVQLYIKARDALTGSEIQHYVDGERRSTRCIMRDRTKVYDRERLARCCSNRREMWH